MSESGHKSVIIKLPRGLDFNELMLELFIEKYAQKEVESVMLNAENTEACVDFSKPITDFEDLKARFRGKPFKNTDLVFELPRPAILVKNVPPKATEDPDLLSLYFESRRAGGGEVVDVEIHKTRREAVVYLKSQEDLAGVLSVKKHEFKEHVLVVAKHDGGSFNTSETRGSRPDSKTKEESGGAKLSHSPAYPARRSKSPPPMRRNYGTADLSGSPQRAGSPSDRLSQQDPRRRYQPRRKSEEKEGRAGKEKPKMPKSHSDRNLQELNLPTDVRSQIAVSPGNRKKKKVPTATLR